MRLYSLRKNHRSLYLQNQNQIYGKVAFKTKEGKWLDTSSAVIVLISVESAFHSEIDGDLKMEALLSVIKNNVKGHVVVLVADAAHLYAQSLDSEANLAFSQKAAENLLLRYRAFFQGCEVAYWSSLVRNDPDYPAIRTKIENLARIDTQFQACLLADAEAAYTEERKQKYPNKAAFIEKTRHDLLEQCICIQILAKLGFRFLFYPGAPCQSTEYAHQKLALPEKRINWIDVFLSIEKKTIKPAPRPELHNYYPLPISDCLA